MRDLIQKCRSLDLWTRQWFVVVRDKDVVATLPPASLLGFVHWKSLFTSYKGREVHQPNVWDESHMWLQSRSWRSISGDDIDYDRGDSSTSGSRPWDEHEGWADKVEVRTEQDSAYRVLYATTLISIWSADGSAREEESTLRKTSREGSTRPKWSWEVKAGRCTSEEEVISVSPASDQGIAKAAQQD
jgi:hypothetical protein